MHINTSDYSMELKEYGSQSEVLLWMNGKLDFKQYSLSRITDILETLYDVNFVYEDESLKEECFTGQFATDDTPESVLSVLKYTGKFTYQKNGKFIYLYRK
jgi:ferric-dicitrate binding protein FerR (iron transport regulator)